jgi:hypothetical protein
VLKHRLQHGEHRQGDPRHRALFRLRSTGLSVAVGAIRSRRGRHRPRASPQSPNGPIRTRMKPPGSPAARRQRRVSREKMFSPAMFSPRSTPPHPTPTPHCQRESEVCDTNQKSEWRLSRPLLARPGPSWHEFGG